jgi:hypothetical protein
MNPRLAWCFVLLLLITAFSDTIITTPVPSPRVIVLESEKPVIDTAHPTVTAEPTRTSTSTPTKAPTPTLSTVPTLTDLQLLQACLEQGYFCMPIPFEITSNVDWIAGFILDPAWLGGKDPESYYLGFNIEPGTIVTSPFDGVVQQAEDYPRDVVLTISLPAGDTINLTFSFNSFAETYEYVLIAPNESRVSAGDPIIRYIREIHQTVWISDCCELPGILEIYAGKFPHPIPIYPVLIGGEAEIITMMEYDCRDCPYHVLENIPTNRYNLITYEIQPAPNSGFISSIKRFVVKISD